MRWRAAEISGLSGEFRLLAASSAEWWMAERLKARCTVNAIDVYGFVC